MPDLIRFEELNSELVHEGDFFDDERVRSERFGGNRRSLREEQSD